MNRQPRFSPDLIRRRVSALYIHDARARILSINPWDGGVAPRFYLTQTAEARVCRFRADLPDELVDEIRTVCAADPLPQDLTQTPACREAVVQLLASHAPVRQIWTGPAYAFVKKITPSAQPVAIHAQNSDLLKGGLEEWIPDVAHRRPFMAMVEEGRAVALCASVRITADVHEAGVETLPAYRRRGHALNVVAGWAAAVAELGATPFYSTSWQNVASRKVAERLGLPLFGVDFHIT